MPSLLQLLLRDLNPIDRVNSGTTVPLSTCHVQLRKIRLNRLGRQPLAIKLIQNQQIKR